MYQAKRAMFLYTVSPLHMGAGTALGVIDSPIQRERHTGHPMMAGSGIKGAIRDHVRRTWDNGHRDMVNRIFGPEPSGGELHAGAVTFTDAAIVLLPVRSLKRSYVYATCPTALGRLQRVLAQAGHPDSFTITSPEVDDALVLDEKLLLDKDQLYLESFRFKASVSKPLADIAVFLEDHAVPADAGMEYFASKIGSDLVVLHDDRFNYFAKNSMVVEPHVRINDETGTADDGGLFYVENLPPESLLVSLVLTSAEYRSKSESKSEPRSRSVQGSLDDGRFDAREVLAQLVTGVNGNASRGLDGQLVQFGGDATTGRGLVTLRFPDPAGREGGGS